MYTSCRIGQAYGASTHDSAITTLSAGKSKGIACIGLWISGLQRLYYLTMGLQKTNVAVYLDCRGEGVGGVKLAASPGISGVNSTPLTKEDDKCRQFAQQVNIQQ